MLIELELNERRIVAVFFAGMASFSALAAAVAPAFI